MANVQDSSSFRILARGLELPEDTFIKMHGFDDPSETYRKLGVMTLVTSSDYRLSSSLHEVVRHCAHIIEAEAFWSLTNPFGSYPIMIKYHLERLPNTIILAVRECSPLKRSRSSWLPLIAHANLLLNMI